MDDAYSVALDFVRQQHPGARAAFLGGSAATGAATSTSDLDVVVLVDDADACYVQTVRHRGWLVEAFVYSPARAQQWMEKGRRQRRPVLDSLIATGLALTEDDETSAWAERSRAVLAAGPAAAAAEEVDLRRYALSSLVDDLDGVADPAEGWAIAASAFREAAELVLLVERRWLGTGKWLVRSLREGNDYGLLDWAAGDGKTAALAAVCRRVLEVAGGYLQEGYVRGERTAHTDAE